MKEIVSYYLKSITCEPKKYYYYDSSTVCFICDLAQACFNFGLVNREGQKMMNPKGKPYLVKLKEFNVKVADFYTDNLASTFNCQKENNQKLKCEKGLTFIMDKSGVRIFLSDLNNLEGISENICQAFGTKFLNCENFVCKCESMGVGIKVNPENRELDYYFLK